MSSSSSSGKGKPASSAAQQSSRADDDHGADGEAIRGGRGDDILTGTAGNDDIKGKAGGDTIYGLGGNDDLKGNTGDDTIYGGDGRDEIKADTGNDTVDGGSGSDHVDAGSGNDVAIYVMSENVGARDEYDGGSGVDTLRLVFTRDEWLRADVQADVARYLAFLAANTNPSGQANGHEFEFRAFNLEVEKFEKLEVTVDGQMLDPRDQLADAIDDAASTTEDATLTGNVLANDSVPDLVRTVELVTGPAQGTLTLDANGSYTYVPGASFNSLAEGETATQSFVYRVTDADGDTDTATVTITITGTNDGPVAVADTAAGTENQALVIDVLANDSDVDHNAVLHVSAASVPAGNGTVTINPDSTLAFDPGSDFDHLAAGATATVTVTYTVADEHGATDTKTVAITVTGTNDAPEMTSGAQAGAVTEDQVLSVSGTVSSSDVDDAATATYSGNAPGAYGNFVVDAATGAWTYTLDNAAHQDLAGGETHQEIFTVTVTDDQGASATQDVTITIAGTNDAPVITSAVQAGAVTEDTALTVSGQVSSTDVDHGATAAYSGNAPGAYGSFVVDAVTGAWTYTLDNAAHQDLAAGESHDEVFAVTVTDDQGGTATQDVTVTVTGTNDGPVITGGETTGVVTEDGASSATGHLVVLDPDHNATQTWTVVGGTSSADADYQFRADSFTVLRNGVTLFQDDFADGVAPPSAPTFTGTNGYTGIGASAGALTESDGKLVFDSSLAIPFEGVGTPDPIVGQNAVLRTNIDPSQAGGLKSTANFTIMAVFDLALPDSPRESYGIRATDRLVGGPGTPPDQLGDDVIELMVRETRGAELQVVLREIDHVADQTTLIEALALNAPVGADQIRLRLDHSTTDVGALHASFEFLSGGAVVGSQAFSQAGRIFGSETPGDTSDDENWTRAEILARAPLHSDSVLSGDYGTLYVTQSGEWTYSLDNARASTQALAAGETVTDVFTVEVADEHGASDSQTVTVTVTGTNDGPVVLTQNTSRTLAEDSPTHAVTATGLVQFDDVDLADTHTVAASLQSASVAGGGALPAGLAAALGTAMSATLVDASTGEGHGDFRWDFALNDGATQFLAAGQTLVATYQVSVSDGAASATQTVTINITGSNDGPVVTSGAQAGAVTEDGVLSVSGQVASSDVDDGATATYIGDATGAYGSFVVNAATGEWTYTLDNAGHQDLAAGETHQETFTVTVSDDQGATATQDVTVTITGTNDAPVLTVGADAGAATEDGTLIAVGQLSASDVDHGATQTWTVQGATSSAYGSMAVDGAGQWTYTLANGSSVVQALAAGETHNEVFTIRVTDDQGAFAEHQVAVTVTGTNDVPVVSGADVSGVVTEIGTPSASLTDSGTLAFTDLDITDAHSIGAVTPSAGALGTLTAAVTTDTTGSGTGGVVTWNYGVDASAVEYLAAGQTKVESYTFNVLDGNGGSVPRTVSVTLTGTNDAPVISAADTSGGVTAVPIAPEAAPQPLAFTVQQFLGFQSNDLNTLRSYATSHAASYTAQTSVIDYTDDPGGFAGELPGSNRWPAAEALNVTGTGGVNDVFFARITADFSVSTADTYTFRTYNDDGVFLLIDNQLVISDTGYHPEAPFQGSIALAPGNHTVELFFYENGGEASLEFSARNSTGSFGLVGANGGGLGGAISQVTDSGVISFTDVDLTDAHVVSATPVGGTLGTLTATKNADTTGSGTGGQLTWSYAVANSAIAYLDAGETKVESFTITVNDQHGGVTTQQVDVTITGTNDVPVITGGAATGAVTEDGASSATGQLIVLDADHNATQSWTVVGGTGSGDADYQFRADSFTVIRNGTTFFQDDFSDGVAPPSAPAFPATNGYGGIGVTAGALSESGGKLVFDSDAAILFEGTGTTDPIVGQNAILRSNIDPASPAGLKSTANFTIQAVFDLVLPDSPRESYGIRATDRLVGGSGTPPDQAGDDTIELMVRESLNGQLQVALREVDFLADQTTNIQVLALDAPIGADQIRLRLDHSTSDVGALHASFDFLSNGAVVGTRTFSAVGRIFGTETPGDASDDENWTRAEILARAPLHDDSVLTGLYGDLNVNQSGEWTYTLDNGRAATQNLATGETVTDVFTVQVADEHGASDTQTINVTVTGTNDAPVILTGPVARTMGEDGPGHQLAATGLMQFDDVDLTDTHTVSAALQSATVTGGGVLPGGLQAALSGAMTTLLTNEAQDGHGDLQWNFALNDAATQFLNAGQTLTAVYDLTVSDGTAAAVKSVTVNITGVNDAPFATNDDATTAEDTPVTINVLANDTDADGDALTITGFSGLSHGTAQIVGNKIVFTPTANFAGTELLSYTVSDGHGGTDTAGVVVNVTPVNDAPVLGSTLRGGSVLFVDDDRGLNGQGTWLTALAAKGYTVDYEAIAANGDPVRDLSGYGAVIWSNGDQAYSNLTAENVATLQAYLNGGGRLLYAGGHDLYDEPYVTAAGFAQNYLGVNNYNFNMPYISNGTPASGELGSVTLSPWAGGYYGGTMISGFNAIGGTSRTLLELGGGNDIAAINSTSTFRAATWSFDLNQLDAPYRNNVLDQTLKALGIGLATNEDTALSLAGLTVSDVDAGTLSVTLSAAHGDLGVTAVAALSGFTGNGSGSLTLTGSAAALNQALATLSYTPDANFNGKDAVNVAVSDLGNTGSGGPLGASGSYEITVRPVADTHVLSNLVSNGSFEQFSGGGTSNGSTAITGWTVTGSDVDRVASSGWQSGDGSYSLDLNGFHPGGVQQVLQTAAGVQYTVGFDLSKNPGNTDHATVVVSAAGSSQSYTFSDANSAGDMKWSQQSFTFVATGTSTTLNFSSTYPTDATGAFPVNAQGPALDEVVVVSNKTIDGFTKGAGGDVLQLTDVLTSVSAPHDSSAFSGGFVRFLQSGSDTLVQIDANGGSDGFLTLATLTNTLLTQADTANYTL